MRRINIDMAKYTKQESTQGLWVDKSKIETGMKATIASEVDKVAGEYEGKANVRNIGRISIEGGEEQNVSFNKTSINALVEAFGEESSEWQGEKVTLQIENTVINNQRRKIIYFIPEGFVLMEDASGSLVIQKKEDEIPVIEG